MRDLNQLIIKFDYQQNFKDDDFYVSSSNGHIFSLLNRWPDWEKNFLNISGEKFSGKTHLINIFLKKFNGIKIDSKKFSNDDLKKIKPYQNIILEDLDNNIDEKLIYSLLNIIDLENKYIIITSKVPIVNIIDGIFNCVTRIPLNKPHRVPDKRAIIIDIGILIPAL